MTLSIAIAGAAGRMGRALIAAASESDCRVVGGTERAGSSAIGLPIEGEVLISDDVRAAAAEAQVWLDFTAPAATLAALDALASTPVRAAIVGTTGFTPDEEAKLNAHGNRIALVRSGNFSLGVNMLAELVKQAAEKLGAGWDIEIVEAHHRRKVDAPSGTAILLGEAAAQGRGTTLRDAKLPPRDGHSGPRPIGGVGFAVVRGGGWPGEHDVIFAAEREVLTLSHSALDRAVFADGALSAARWAVDKPPGLYTMRDVLGL